MSRSSGLRQLLDAVVPDDPWCRSTEGLDDGCHFCGSSVVEYGSGGDSYFHEPDCSWVTAMDFLGRSHPAHQAGGIEAVMEARRIRHAEWRLTAPGWLVDYEDHIIEQINHGLEIMMPGERDVKPTNDR